MLNSLTTHVTTLEENAKENEFYTTYIAAFTGIWEHKKKNKVEEKKDKNGAKKMMLEQLWLLLEGSTWQKWESKAKIRNKKILDFDFCFIINKL